MKIKCVPRGLATAGFIMMHLEAGRRTRAEGRRGVAMDDEW